MGYLAAELGEYLATRIELLRRERNREKRYVCGLFVTLYL